ncbi:LexA family protein [Petrimonas sp.]|uniref:LexA family protein n=1 Tax=Petrimonas sp. TaxID=2023866 RepID=UPI003F5148C1
MKDIKKIFSTSEFEFFKPALSTLELPLYDGIPCGFTSPADDHIQDTIDLNKTLIKHPEATFFARANGYSLAPLVLPGSILTIDRAEEWHPDLLAACFIDREFTAKWIKQTGDIIRLIPFNAQFPVLEYNIHEAEISIWGIITSIINQNVRYSRLQQFLR